MPTRFLKPSSVEKRQLMDGDPRIAVLRRKGALMFTLLMNEPGDEKVVARRMREIFSSSRKV